MTDKNNQVRPPFVMSLPLDRSEYQEILTRDNAVNMRSGLVTLKPGQTVGEHSTEDYEELVIVLHGTGEIETVGVGRRPISAGEVAYNPPQTKHDVHNTGADDMRYIYIVSKA
jgi:quercetin dioxygenase-like cupin family protein